MRCDAPTLQGLLDDPNIHVYVVTEDGSKTLLDPAASWTAETVLAAYPDASFRTEAVAGYVVPPEGLPAPPTEEEPAPEEPAPEEE